MSDQNMSGNDWLLVNEAYIKNQKNRRKKALVLILILLVFAFAIFLGFKESDRRAYMCGIEDYYDTLNKGSSYKNDYMKLDIKESTEDYLSKNGYASYNDWLIILQQLDTKIMEEKYGKGFKVTYNIEKTEAFTEKELDEYENNDVVKGEYDKAYRISMKEHFKGPKDEGFEEQYIIAAHKKGKQWLFQDERRIELIKDTKFIKTISAHYKRLNELSEDIRKLSDYDFSEYVMRSCISEINMLTEKYGEGFQVKHTLKSISPMSEEELKRTNKLHSREDDPFIRGYKINIIEHFNSSEGENTNSTTIMVPYKNDNSFHVYSERWDSMY